ncbi:pilus assembly PilX family protein [Methylomonas sp. MgM2]
MSAFTEFHRSGEPIKSWNSLKGQHGATLFTALIFLVMLMLLGVNAAQMSGIEERMAGNNRNRDLAFQAAEAALKHVEQNLNAGENIKDLVFDGTVAGLRTFNACLPNTADYWNNCDPDVDACPLDCNGTEVGYVWSNTSARKPAHTLTLNQDDSVNATLQPMYVVEKVGANQYRVTARGLGGDGESVVILQTMLEYTP